MSSSRRVRPSAGPVGSGAGDGTGASVREIRARRASRAMSSDRGRAHSPWAVAAARRSSSAAPARSDWSSASARRWRTLARSYGRSSPSKAVTASAQSAAVSSPWARRSSARTQRSWAFHTGTAVTRVLAASRIRSSASARPGSAAGRPRVSASAWPRQATAARRTAVYREGTPASQPVRTPPGRPAPCPPRQRCSTRPGAAAQSSAARSRSPRWACPGTGRSTCPRRRSPPGHRGRLLPRRRHGPSRPSAAGRGR